MQTRTVSRISERTGKHLAVVFFVLLALAVPALAGQEYSLGPKESAIEEHLIVRLTHGVAPSGVLQAVAPGATAEAIRGASDTYLIRLRGTSSSTARVIASTQLASTRSASARLAAHPNVLYVEPDRILTTQALSPNDPQFAAQWGFQNIQAINGWGQSPGAFLPNVTANPNRTIVAVLDSGADCTHPDFMNAGGSSTDSASGGQLSFSLSKAYEPTTLPSPACSWQDDLGHGTHVAGIIAASANNAVGVAGLGYPLQLMVYKVLIALDGEGVGDTYTISQAIIDAANNGAAVISMSLSTAGYSPTLQSAINYAWQKNTLVVAATGNNGSNALNFPGGANYAIGVGATDSNDAWAGFSSYGNQVAVGAPGVNILSTLPGASYGYLSGTSMATPWVAALGGLLSSASPNVSIAALAMRIEQSADNSNVGGAADQYLGYGRINVANALSGNLRPATQGGITGQAVDPTYHNALANVTITVGGQTYTTDSTTGLYRFYGLNAGQYTISASAAGYPTLSQQVMVASGADTQFSVVMGGSPAEFTGTVSDGGIPVAGAIVQAIDGGGLIQASAVTGTNGQYFLYVQAGAYSIRSSAMFYLTTTLSSQTIASGASATFNLNLPAMGRIKGSVTLSNGSPATNATLLINSASTTTIVTPDITGNFSTIGLAAANYTLNGFVPGLTNVTASTVLTANSVPVLSLQFPSNGSNTIRAGISSKSGPASERQWSLSFTNQGTQPFNSVTVTGFGLVQQGGPTCTPRLLTPLPAIVGNVGPSGVLTGNLIFDFSSCTAAARFTATMPFTANSQAADGLMTLNNQFQ